eukprot:TRINITY_DN1051_c0_g1_i1.p1 TRINITY_DN1051_c0_g1~~TRINITY_DN1051_c0_g1_i1.p1  ORF type:complete len:325 (-),score=14.91 TRINITY_DN1051_c0_g1_i1:141-1115(-)
MVTLGFAKKLNKVMEMVWIVLGLPPSDVNLELTQFPAPTEAEEGPSNSDNEESESDEMTMRNALRLTLPTRDSPVVGSFESPRMGSFESPRTPDSTRNFHSTNKFLRRGMNATPRSVKRDPHLVVRTEKQAPRAPPQVSQNKHPLFRPSPQPNYRLTPQNPQEFQQVKQEFSQGEGNTQQSYYPSVGYSRHPPPQQQQQMHPHPLHQPPHQGNGDSHAVHQHHPQMSPDQSQQTQHQQQQQPQRLLPRLPLNSPMMISPRTTPVSHHGHEHPIDQQDLRQFNPESRSSFFMLMTNDLVGPPVDYASQLFPGLSEGENLNLNYDG